MYFWMLFVCLALCKELWRFPQKDTTWSSGNSQFNWDETVLTSAQHWIMLHPPQAVCLTVRYAWIRILEAKLLRVPSAKAIASQWGFGPTPTHINSLVAQYSCIQPLLSSPCCVLGGCVFSHCGSAVLPSWGCYCSPAHSNLLNLPYVKCWVNYQQQYKNTTQWRIKNTKVLQVLKFISPLSLRII